MGLLVMDSQLIVSSAISLVSVLAGAAATFWFNRISTREQRMAAARLPEILNLMDAVEECIQSFKLVRSGTVAIAMSHSAQEKIEADKECAQVLQTLEEQESKMDLLDIKVRLLCSKATIEAFEKLKKAIENYHAEMVIEAVTTGKMSGSKYLDAVELIESRRDNLLKTMREEI